MTITAVSPTDVPVGASDLTLTVTGSGFASGNAVQVNGVALATTFVSSTQLTAVVPAAQLKTGSVLPVSVSSGTLVVKADPAAVALSVDNPVPSLASVAPGALLLGSGDTTVTVTGSNFVQGVALAVNGTPRTTTFVSDTQLTAQLTAADFATAQPLPLNVINPKPGGGTSGTSALPVNNPAPAVSGIAPATVAAGSAATTFTVTGTGLLGSTVLQLNGATHSSTTVSGTQLTFTLSAGELASASTLAVRLSNPQPGGGAADAGSLAVQNPAPVVASATPSTLLAGSDATTVALAGTGFVKGSTVQVNGATHASTYVSPSEVDVPFSSAELAASSTLALTVVNAQPGGGTSAGVSIPVNNPAPVIGGLSPANINTGVGDTTVTISGTGFLPTTSLQVNGTARAVTYISNKQLSVKFAASELTAITTYNLTLANGTPGGGTSNAFQLYIGITTPVITALSPSTLSIGSPATTVTITGTGFLPASTVLFGGYTRPTATYVSSTQMTLPLTTADLAQDGTYSVAISTPSGGNFNTLSRVATFTVQAKPAVLTTVTPSTLTVNGGPYTISVAGTNLSPNSRLQWNGAAISSTYSYTYNYATGGYTYTLNGTVSNDLVGSTGTASITATNLTNATASNALTVTIANPPVPTVTSLSPNAAPVNADVKLTINGTGFTKSSVASYNGTAVTTTFSSATTLGATVPASLLAIPGNGLVTVTTPAPGGGTSTGAALTTYLPITSNNMVYSKTTGLAYLSIPSTGSQVNGTGPVVAGNSIVSLDPATGALGTPIFVGSEPGVMAVSDDGTTLWVALNGTVAIRKVDLVRNVAGAQYSVSALANNAPTAMLVLPGTTDSVAITNSGTLALYDAGVLRGTTVSVNSAYALQADSSRNELYVGGYTLQNFTYSSAGLTLKSSSSNNNLSGALANSSFDEMQLASGKLFTDYGRVYDSESAGLLGSLSVSGTTSSTNTVVTGPTLYDTSLAQIYVVNNGSNYSFNSYNQVNLFNSSDYTSTGKSFQWNIPSSYYVNGQNFYLSPHRLTRWGANGLLLHSRYAIFTAQSNVVKDQSAVSADLSVAVAASGGSTTGSTATYTVTVTNGGPQSATDVALSLVAPGTGVITSTTSSTGTCTSLTGCTFGTLASTGKATVTVTVLQTTAGTGTLSAYVQGSSNDPVITNNSASAAVTVTGDTYNLQPTLTTLSPNAVKAGSADTTLTVTGANFASGSQVMLGTTALTTKYVSANQLTATVPAASVTGMGWANVSVSSPTPGGGTSGSLPLTVFSVTTVGLNHIVYEPYSRKLYASVGSGSSTVAGSSVVSIDPATGTFGTPTTFATVPTVLALSSSGQTLYTALTLPTSSNGTTSIPFGRIDLTNGSSTSPSATLSNTYYSGYAVQQVAVQPGSETTLATTLPYSYSALFDYDATGKILKQRGATNSNYSGTCLAFLDSNNVLASLTYSSDSILPVTAAGFGTAKTLTNLTECFQLSSNLLATPTGKVYSVSTSAATQLGTFVLPSTYNYSSNYPSGTFALDAYLGSAFYAANTQNTTYSSYADGLASFDLNSFLRTGLLNLSIPTIEGSSSYNVAINDLVRWGQDGLAMITSTGHLYLLRGPFVVPGELTANTAATLNTPATTTYNAGRGNTLLTLTGSNFQPGVAVSWNGSYRTTTRLSTTQVTVAIPASDLAAAGTGKLVATNPNASGSNAVTLTVQ